MTEIENHEILGYRINNEDVCKSCVTPEENAEISEKDLILKGETNPNTQGWCARCKDHRLW